MSYVIDAWLERGEPRLRILDAKTGAVRMRWAYRRGADALDVKGADPLDVKMGCHDDDQANVSSLFRGLFLLACADRANIVSAARLATFGDECVNCSGCTEEAGIRPVANGVADHGGCTVR